MRRSLTILLLLFIISQHYCVAQFRKQLDSLSILSRNARSDSDKVVALGKLADLCYTYKLNQKGDSLLREQLRIAEFSDNNNLILLTLFSDAFANIGDMTSESFDKIITFLQKGIEYAKDENRYDYMGMGYTRMAEIFRKRAQYDKALYEATQSLQILPNIKSDSLKAAIYMELGNTYMARGEAVSAVRNFNNAFDIALKMKSVFLQSEIYHCFFEMYFVFLNNKEIAKEFLKKSLKLNKETGNLKGVMKDYYDLSRVTDEKFYLDKSIQLANALHNNRYIISGKRLMLNIIYYVEKNSNKALHYLETDADLKASYLNSGLGVYYQIIGYIYYYSSKYDSALASFKLAEYEFVKKYDESRARSLFNYIASCYKELHDFNGASAYYLKALMLSKKMNDARNIASISDSLSTIYEIQGNFKEAYSYSKQADEYSAGLLKLSKARDIALLDVDRENRKHDDELAQIADKLENKKNVQYMAITIAIGVVFILLLVIGTFPVSKVTIKILGYIFFISLFEFIVLVIDTFLHRITHGEPLRIWLIKIVLIAMLVPVQHFLEHSLIKFLESKKLLKARTNFTLKKLSVKRLWQNIKKPTPVSEADFEEDTAVL